METSQPALRPEPVAVNEAIEELLPRYAALHPMIRFSVPSPSEPDRFGVLADRLGFERAVGNLLENAGRFARSLVSVSVHATDDSVVVDVDDDGGGIPESDRQRVLEPFVRLNDGRHEPGRGVGLGLALVHRIATQHGGRVELLTSPQGGCRARTVWPRAAPASAEVGSRLTPLA